MQHIPIWYVCDPEQSESKGIITDKTLSQVCSTDESEPEIVIVNESSTVENRPENVYKSIKTNKEKYAIYETEDD